MRMHLDKFARAIAVTIESFREACRIRNLRRYSGIVFRIPFVQIFAGAAAALLYSRRSTHAVFHLRTPFSLPPSEEPPFERHFERHFFRNPREGRPRAPRVCPI